MPTTVRRQVAEQLFKQIQSRVTNLSDATSRLAWCVRLRNRENNGDSSSCDEATISYRNLQKSGLLEASSRKEQVQWAKDFESQGNCEFPIQEISANDHGLKIKISLAAIKQEVLSYILHRKERYGMRSIIHDYIIKDGNFARSQRNENVVVEFSSPNIAKPFHAGHLRSTVLGNFVANLNSGLGHNVTRINWLGDWGTQFGLLGVAYLRYGNENALKNDAMKHLFDLYVRINSEAENIDPETGMTYRELGKKLFLKMEAGDYGVLSLWQYFRDQSITNYSQVYDRLGIQFDHYHGEAMYQAKSRDAIRMFKDVGLLNFDNGKGYVDLSNDKHKKLHASLVKSDGTTLYLSRDLAAAIDRQEKFQFDRIHYVVDQSQHAHFYCLLGCLQKLELPWADRPLKEFHVDFGRVEGMSTRKGEVVFLQDILDEGKSRMIEVMRNKSTTKVEEDLESVADKLSMSAIFVQDMTQPRRRNYKFSWERMLQFNGETGVRLQYAHARLCSLERESGIKINEECSLESLQEPSAYNLIMHLARFDEAVHQAFCDIEPYHISRYLFTLVSLINIANKELQVKSQPLDVAQARLVLFHCSRLVLGNGMKLLGLQPLERM